MGTERDDSDWGQREMTRIGDHRDGPARTAAGKREREMTRREIEDSDGERWISVRTRIGDTDSENRLRERDDSDGWMTRITREMIRIGRDGGDTKSDSDVWLR